MNDLIFVRCPFKRTTKTGSAYVCDQLIVKVYAGARGEGYCTRCKQSFEFDISRSGYELGSYPLTTVVTK